MLKLDGKPFDLRPSPPSVVAVKAYLDGQPPDELYSFTEIQARTSLGKDSLLRMTPLLSDYTRLHRQRRYWGNPEAIKELDRRLNEVG